MRRKPPTLPGYRVEVRLCGSGGQGLIFAGLILAEAAGIHDGREVAMVQSYGPEARGGASKAEVIISDYPIDYPLCTSVDLLLAMNQEAVDTYSSDVKKNAWVLVDSDLVEHPPGGRAVGIPFTSAARDKLGRPVAANVVALGALCELTGLVTRRALEKALAAKAPPGSEEVNKKALALGIRLVRHHPRKDRGAPENEIRFEDM